MREEIAEHGLESALERARLRLWRCPFGALGRWFPGVHYGEDFAYAALKEGERWAERSPKKQLRALKNNVRNARREPFEGGLKGLNAHPQKGRTLGQKRANVRANVKEKARQLGPAG